MRSTPSTRNPTTAGSGGSTDRNRKGLLSRTDWSTSPATRSSSALW